MKIGTNVIVYGVLIGTVIGQSRTIGGSTFWHVLGETGIIKATIEHLYPI